MAVTDKDVQTLWDDAGKHLKREYGFDLPAKDYKIGYTSFAKAVNAARNTDAWAKSEAQGTLLREIACRAKLDYLTMAAQYARDTKDVHTACAAILEDKADLAREVRKASN
jgi:hypothetical protein